MIIYDILGYIGTFLIIISLVPQLIKTYREKKVDNISILFPLIQVIAGVCMIPYGIYLKSTQIIVINVGMLCSALILIGQIIYYEKDEMTIDSI